jgi:DNA polymerase-3 subunit delta'
MEGIGRRKTALELAKALNCTTNNFRANPEPCDACQSCKKINNASHPDVKTVDFSWQAMLLDQDVEKQRSIKIETIRTLQKDITLKASEGRWKVYLIEPAEKITTEAANCLLKTLEEPPPLTVIILLSRHRENLPATIVSRTQIIRFQPISEPLVSRFLQDNCAQEPQVALKIAGMAEGSISRAMEYIAKPQNSAKEIWGLIKSQKPSIAKLMAASAEHADDAETFLGDLLVQLKNDFRRNPSAFAEALEHTNAARAMLSRNVNAQMLLDLLLIQLRSVGSAGSDGSV